MTQQQQDSTPPVKSEESGTSIPQTTASTPGSSLPWVLFVVVLLAVAAYFGWTKMQGSESDTDQVQSETMTDTTQAMQQDESTVIAEVNDEIVTQGQVNERVQQIIATSFPPDGTGITDEILQQINQQATQQLVNETLLLQAAASANFVTDSALVDQQIEQIKTGFDDEAAYQQALQSQSMTEEKLRRDIAKQLTLQTYLENSIDFSQVTIADEEVTELYDFYAAQQENMPAIDEIRSQLEAQIRQQKEDGLIGQLLQQLSVDAEITVY